MRECFVSTIDIRGQFPKDFDLDYNSDSKLLIVEYILPAPDDLPTLTDVKYIAAKKELKESFLSETQLSKIYDSAIYKITLRTLHELFEADKAEALGVIIFNGWVNAINKATGKKVSNCIVTIEARKAEFNEIELSNVDAKTCFKNLKGIGSSKLSSITAVQPIAQINKNNKRFIPSHEVANQLNEVEKNGT
jgi:restriction system protein